MKHYIIIITSGFTTGVISGMLMDMFSKPKDIPDDLEIDPPNLYVEADDEDPDKYKDLNSYKNILDINEYVKTRTDIPRPTMAYGSICNKPNLAPVENYDYGDGTWADTDIEDPEDPEENDDDEFSEEEEGEEEFFEMKQDKPNKGNYPLYTISPDEFGELDDYGTETLFYFEDGVLTDSNYRLISDVDAYVGFEALDKFGEYEYDSVFVRNDNSEMDYEILSDPRSYKDVAVRLPKPHEV